METFRWISIVGIACIASGIGIILAANDGFNQKQPTIGWVLIAIGLFITLFLLNVAYWSIPVLF